MKRVPRQLRSADARARCAGFTLLEILMAAAAGAVILTAIYGVFSRAVRLRDDATARAREAGLRARAAQVLRDDLQNAFVSDAALAGDPALAGTIEGGPQAERSRFPGFLRFTATTGTSASDEVLPEVQEVEYYIGADPEASAPGGGALMRAVDQDLTAPLRQPTREERILPGVEALEVSFYDGTTWSDSWDSVTAGDLPRAVRVVVRMAAPASEKARLQPPIEILVPWPTEKAASS